MNQDGLSWIFFVFGNVLKLCRWAFWYYIDLWVPLINNVSRHLVSHRDIKVAIIKYIIKIKLFFGFIAAVLFLCFFLCLRISWQTLWVGSCRYSGRRPTGKCIVDITLLILSPLFVFNFSRISWTKFLFLWYTFTNDIRRHWIKLK